MTTTLAARIAAGVGFVGVALGAFGAHGLRHVLETNGTAEIWRTAVLYHLVHAVMLFVIASRTPFAKAPWWCFLIGIAAFSGSLYVLALAKTPWMGPVTPMGGACFLVGWGWLAICPGKRPSGE